MARLTTFRRAPRAALVVWQSTSVAAVLAALFAAPAALPYVIGPTPELARNATQIAVAVAVTGLVAGRLMLSGHRVGMRLRANRRRHRRLVDLLAVPPDEDSTHAAHMRVIEHPTPRPTASRGCAGGWCSPRGRSMPCRRRSCGRARARACTPASTP